jgi:ribonucleoside-diphosphate reductase alpha chain
VERDHKQVRKRDAGTIKRGNMYKYEQVIQESNKYFQGDELAASVFASKYSLQDSQGNFLESSPAEMHDRLANEFARIESNYPNPMSKSEIYELFDKFKYVIPQGSPMSGIGNDFQIQSISNCFVIASPEDSYGGILKTDQEQVQIMKRRGGVGFDVSNIRPKNLPTSNAAKTTSGLEVFLDRFSNSCREVAQGGRRGALMISLSVHHPQIRDFIKIKRDLTRVTGANISIRLSEEFMRAVKGGDTFQLRFPVDAKQPIVEEWISAQELWHEIVESAHASAEPGLLFWDTAKSMTPSDIYEAEGFGSTSTNPCVIGSTIVETNAGPKTVKELSDNKASFFVRSFNTETREVEMKPAIAFKTKENAQVLKVKTKSGKTITLTHDHRVFTDQGWVEASKLTSSHKILSIS